MNKKALTSFLVIVLVISMLTMMATMMTSVSAVHTPAVTVYPEYWRGIYPEWKDFTVTNVGEGDPIVEVSITHPETSPAFKPVEYEFPSGWKATYYPALLQVVFESINYTEYNIPSGNSEVFSIHFEEGPTEEGTYTFIVSTTDTNEYAANLYVDQFIDTTLPLVEIIYPLTGAAIKGDPGLWINVTASDAGPGIPGVTFVGLYVRNSEHGEWVAWPMSYDEDRDVYYWYGELWEDGAWYDARAVAYDKAGNEGWSPWVSFFWFVTTVIDVSPPHGPVGTIVTVTGGAFTPYSEVGITFYNTIDHGVVATATADNLGFFTTQFEVPVTPGGDYFVDGTDTEGVTAYDMFTVKPWITITPTSGIVGTLIEVTGTGFPNDKDVDILWGGFANNRLDYSMSTYLTWNGSWTFRIPTVGGDLLVATVESDSIGSFITSFHAPESWGGFHPVWAEVGGVPTFQEQIFSILPSIEIDPSSGVSGQYVHLYGTGWAYPGTYEMWNDPNHNLEWEECEQGFRYESSGDAGLVLDFGPNQRYIDEAHRILNGQANSEWVDLYYPVKIDARGTIIYHDIIHDVVGKIGSPFLQVPFLQPGDYEVKVYRFIEYEKMLDIHPGREPKEIIVFENYHIYSDVVSASTTFTIEPLQVDLTEVLEKLEDLQGDIDAMADLIVEYADKLQMEHEDLADLITEVADKLQMEHQDLIELIGSVADKLQMEHEDLADLITEVFDELEIKLDDINSEIVGKVDGLYLVIGDLEVKLDDIKAQIVGVIEDTEGNILVAIDTALGQITARFDQIDAKLVDIQGDLATISTTLGEIETKIDNLGAVSLEEIKGDIVTIKSEIGTVKTSLTDINTKITVNTDNIATIKTDIGTIQGKLTSIEGDIATIETDIGTIQTSTDTIEDTTDTIKGDTSLQLPTIALSLIAAIGAIAAVALILRKVYMK